MTGASTQRQAIYLPGLLHEPLDDQLLQLTLASAPPEDGDLAELLVMLEA